MPHMNTGKLDTNHTNIHTTYSTIWSWFYIIKTVSEQVMFKVETTADMSFYIALQQIT